MILDAEIKIRLMGQPENGEFHGKNLMSFVTEDRKHPVYKMADLAI